MDLFRVQLGKCLLQPPQRAFAESRGAPLPRPRSSNHCQFLGGRRHPISPAVLLHSACSNGIGRGLELRCGLLCLLPRVRTWRGHVWHCQQEGLLGHRAGVCLHLRLCHRPADREWRGQPRRACRGRADGSSVSLRRECGQGRGLCSGRGPQVGLGHVCRVHRGLDNLLLCLPRHALDIPQGPPQPAGAAGAGGEDEGHPIGSRSSLRGLPGACLGISEPPARGVICHPAWRKAYEFPDAAQRGALEQMHVHMCGSTHQSGLLFRTLSDQRFK
mmetsp:Transcript_47657/g.114452  ORF Transcript_47657/g.114452 Transcript_47657/m.114452 type:complete len:273 (-) Transcript_47657:33-851(-)